MRKHGTKIPWKRPLLAGGGWIRRQRMTLAVSSGSLTFIGPSVLPFCPHPTEKALQVLILGLQINVSKPANLQIWNPQMMRML